MTHADSHREVGNPAAPDLLAGTDASDKPSTEPSTEPSAEPRAEPRTEPETELAWFRSHPMSPVLSGSVAFAALTYFGLKTAARTFFEDGMSFTPVVVGVLVVLIACALTIGISYVWWCARWFAVDEHTLHVRSGKLTKHSGATALASIDAVDIVRSALAKVLGFAALSVRVPDGEDVDIKYLRLAEAQRIRKLLLSPAPAPAPAPAGSAGQTASVVPVAAVGPAETGNPPELAKLHNDTPATQSERSGRVGARRQRKINHALLESRDSITYSLPTDRAMKSQLLLYVPAAIILVAVAAVGVTVLIGLGLSGELTAELATITGVTILQFAIVAFGGALALARVLTRNYGSEVRHADGVLVLKRGLFKDFTATSFVDRVHWVELRQPFMWRRQGWWRLRVRSMTALDDIDDDTPDSSEGGKSSEVLLPVATVAEVLRVLELLKPAIGADGDHIVALATRTQPLEAVTPDRARWFNPIVHGHEGFARFAGGIFARTGRFSTRLVVVPMRHVQEVRFEVGPLQKALRLGDVVLSGAGGIKEHRLGNLDQGCARAQFEDVREQICRLQQPQRLLWRVDPERAAPEVRPM